MLGSADSLAPCCCRLAAPGAGIMRNGVAFFGDEELLGTPNSVLPVAVGQPDQ